MNDRHFTLARVALLLGAGIVSGCSDHHNSPAAPTVSFSSPANASAINLGQSLTLSWTSTGANSCTASGSGAAAGNFTGPQSVSGSFSVAPTAATAPATVSYTLSCTGSGGTTSASTPAITVNPSILSTLSPAGITVIGNTPDTVELGGNPYGLAIAPASSGLITAGDLIACNFNDGATNTQGMGTTLVGLHPVASANPGGNAYRIALSAQLTGCSALAILPDDSIAGTAYSSGLVPLVSATGTVNNPFAADSFSHPWSAAFVAAHAGQPAALYVSNVGTGANGSIDRIALSGDSQSGLTEIATGFCGRGVPGAVYAPAGLTYDPSIDTLYVVDTSSYSVIALANVSAIGSDGVMVNGNCGTTAAGAPTPVPVFSGASASSASIIVNGGMLNAPISAALLSDGDLVVSNGDIDGPAVPNLLFEISPALGFVGNPVQLDTSGTPGGLFGLVATVDGSGNQFIYFNDDNTNTVNLLSK